VSYNFFMEVDDEVMVGAVKRVKRYLITPMGGYFPVLVKLGDGSLAVVFRMGDYHIGQRGRLEMATSSDGGKSWSSPRLVTASQTDDRNPAFCQLKDGTLLVAFARIWGYENGLWQRDKMRCELLITRSIDTGKTWSAPTPIDVPVKLGSPYARMTQLEDGTVLMSAYDEEKGVGKSYIIRSRDNGFTWGDVTLVAEGTNETSILKLTDGNMVAALRTPKPDGEAIDISHSQDSGYTWSKPKPLTIGGEHPGDLCVLKSGKVLLTFGHRRVPYGVHAVISPDQGKSWRLDRSAALVSYATNTDCGYPSTVQLDDGTIYTAYYATTCLTFREFGIHAAGVAYKEDIFT